MAVFAAAAPSGGISNSCNTGPVQCCNSVTSSESPVISTLLGLLGVVLGDVTTQVGLTCSPLSVVGLGSGSSCTSQPVCCENNSFNGVVAIGCSPINLNL
ncbi:hydrophobin [Pholiota conissans]|uniref:Hydrophobin n=1 Tax=Pholiota conissans TaxID=109636 RepID=A0A9P5YRB0_9AGAR|nr:hydrophobin [Pholiota conissans]